MKVKVSFLIIIALLFFITGAAAFLLMYIKGDQLLPHEVVFVPKGGARVEAYTTITGKNFKDLFITKDILAAAVNPNMVTSDTLKEVMNKTMIMPLYPGDALTLNHVRDASLVPKPDENEYPIPANWLEVLDWTGRPGDMVEIWLFPTDRIKQYYMKQLSKADQDTLDLVPDTVSRPLKHPVLDQIHLRYVIDGANHAVHNMKDGEDRSEATGVPTAVKANLKSEQYAQLKNSVEEGYKLIVVSKGEPYRGS